MREVWEGRGGRGEVCVGGGGGGGGVMCGACDVRCVLCGACDVRYALCVACYAGGVRCTMRATCGG